MIHGFLQTVHCITRRSSFSLASALPGTSGAKARSVLRGSYGIYYARQNMLTQVGSITTNGVQQQTIAGGLFANPSIPSNLARTGYSDCGFMLNYQRVQRARPRHQPISVLFRSSRIQSGITPTRVSIRPTSASSRS